MNTLSIINNYLVLFIGTVYWYCLLVLFIGTVYFNFYIPIYGS